MLWTLGSKGVEGIPGSIGSELFFPGRILPWFPNVYGSSRGIPPCGSRLLSNAMEKTMKRTLIRYKTKPDAAEQNAGLIAKVFEELKAKAPNGVRYLSLRLDDDTFVHFVEAEDGSIPLPSLDAFKAFQSGIRERCVEPPVPSGVSIVGNYRMLSEN
jgi:hypothetical protein